MKMQTKTFNVYNHDNQAVQDAYAMLTANIHLIDEKSKFKSIVLTSCKPGVGKTTIAISLALSMATAGWRVLLIDADMRKPSESKRLNNESLLGFSDCLSHERDISEVLCKTNVSNLTYVSCGRNTSNPISLLCSIRFKEFMNNVRNDFDFIIFDTPSLSSVADASLIAAKADSTLIVVKMGETKITTLKPAIDQLEKVNSNILGVVLSKVKKREYRKHFEAFDYFKDSRKFMNLKYKKTK